MVAIGKNTVELSFEGKFKDATTKRVVVVVWRKYICS
jgi:hypothetical protein